MSESERGLASKLMIETRIKHLQEIKLKQVKMHIVEDRRHFASKFKYFDYLDKNLDKLKNECATDLL